MFYMTVESGIFKNTLAVWCFTSLVAKTIWMYFQNLLQYFMSSYFT